MLKRSMMLHPSGVEARMRKVHNLLMVLRKAHYLLMESHRERGRARIQGREPCFEKLCAIKRCFLSLSRSFPNPLSLSLSESYGGATGKAPAALNDSRAFWIRALNRKDVPSLGRFSER